MKLLDEAGRPERTGAVEGAAGSVSGSTPATVRVGASTPVTAFGKRGEATPAADQAGQANLSLRAGKAGQFLADRTRR